MAKKKNEPPLGNVGLSAAAVALIFVVWPLVMGGSIALAIAFGDEVQSDSAPDEHNGFNWITTTNCHNPSNLVLQDPYGIEGIGNYTFLNLPSSGQNCFIDGATLQIPPTLLDQEDSISKFQYFWISNSYNNRNAGYESSYSSSLDYELKINGVSIFEGNDYQYVPESKQSSTPQSFSQYSVHYAANFEHVLDGVELNKLRSEIEDCGSSCNVTITFSDFKEINNPNPSVTIKTPNTTDGLHRIQTFTTDGDTEGLIFSLSPYIVTVLTLGVAIGSTRFWNPLMGVLRQ